MDPDKAAAIKARNRAANLHGLRSVFVDVGDDAPSGAECVSAQDDRVCDTCQAFHGRILPADECRAMVEGKAPLLPHDVCTSDFCRCSYRYPLDL